MRIALFGGSFDPPHQGHAKIIETAFCELPIDKLYIAPAYLNPFKNNARFPAFLRLKWMRTIAHDSPNSARIIVTDFEIANGYPTPTIETVRFLKKSENIKHLYLLLGSDQIPRLHEWHAFAELKELVEFVIIQRSKTKSVAQIARSFRTLEFHEPVSSSEIRLGLNKGELKDELKEAIPACIRDEVLAQNPSI
ncbi:MAG: nicotinate (nicotinamide) nucleotide adenylyltransferase [Wolinella sp.]